MDVAALSEFLESEPIDASLVEAYGQAVQRSTKEVADAILHRSKIDSIKVQQELTEICSGMAFPGALEGLGGAGEGI